jgi:uncharacterized protein YcfL
MKKLTFVLALLGFIFVSCRQNQVNSDTENKDTIFLDGRSSDTIEVDSTKIDSVTNK